MPTLMIEGDVIEADTRDEQIADLRHEVEQLRLRLRGLQRTLLPLYRSLQGVFGDLELAVGEPGDVDELPRTASVKTDAWQKWIDELGSGSAPARFIEALMKHGPQSAVQMKVTGRMAGQTVYDSANRLKRLGLITKSGGKYELVKL